MATRRRSEARQYQEHLVSVFNYLVRSPPVGSYALTLSNSCSNALRQLEDADWEDWAIVMQPWKIELQSPEAARSAGGAGLRRGQEQCLEIVMGAEICAEGGVLKKQTIPVNIVIGPRCFSHGPPWCSAQDSTKAMAIRRVHFDYDASVTDWSPSHIQVGGNPTELTRAGDYYFAVSEDPSEPRIPAPRFDVVIVLDMMLRQFSSRLTLPQERDWRNHVRRSEEILLRNYFERTHNHLQGTAQVPLAEFRAD